MKIDRQTVQFSGYNNYGSFNNTQCCMICIIIALTLGGPPTDIEPGSSVLTERAMETIRLLRRELERCHADLQTDEELFAEKMDELSQLQSAYNQLLREKERLEEMWLASQENEGTQKGNFENLCKKCMHVHVHVFLLKIWHKIHRLCPFFGRLCTSQAAHVLYTHVCVMTVDINTCAA